MSKTYFSSDFHFGHKNIIRYEKRPFKDVHHMNESLVRNWNRTVRKGDLVYFLGDLAFKNKKYWARRLNGRKFFVRGNHDKKWGRHCKVLKHKGFTFY